MTTKERLRTLALLKVEQIGDINAPFRNESVAFRKMIQTAQKLNKGNFGKALFDYAYHKHDESCVMQTRPSECETCKTPDKCTGCYFAVKYNFQVQECETLQDAQERFTQELSHLREMSQCDSLRFTVQIVGYGLHEEIIEDSPHIVNVGEYYSKRELSHNGDCHWISENNVGSCEGKPHSEYCDIKVTETATHMVGRGKKRHEEPYTYERTVGDEACFSEDKYSQDQGYGFIRDTETRLVPGHLQVRLMVQGKFLTGHIEISMPLEAKDEIQDLTYQPFLTNDFNIDPNTVLEKARMLAIEREVRNGNDNPTTPEDDELLEDGDLERAESVILERVAPENFQVLGSTTCTNIHFRD